MMTEVFELNAKRTSKAMLQEVINLVGQQVNIVKFAGEECVMTPSEEILGWLEKPVRYNGETNLKLVLKKAA